MLQTDTIKGSNELNTLSKLNIMSHYLVGFELDEL